MNPEYENPTDPTAQAVGRVEIIISTLLRMGVITSLTIIFIGLTLTFVHHPEYAHDANQLGLLTAKTASFPHSLAPYSLNPWHCAGRRSWRWDC